MIKEVTNPSELQYVHLGNGNNATGLRGLCEIGGMNVGWVVRVWAWSRPPGIVSAVAAVGAPIYVMMVFNCKHLHLLFQGFLWCRSRWGRGWEYLGINFSGTPPPMNGS